MLKNLLITLIFLTVLSASGCGGGAPNTNKNTNTNTAVNAVPANVQPEPAISPMPPPANAAGIQSNSTTVQKGATPTPGIPGPTDMKKLARPGVTPTPGIPSPAEIQRMLGGKPPANVNTAPIKGSDVPMMKSNKKLGGKPQ